MSLLSELSAWIDTTPANAVRDAHEHLAGNDGSAMNAFYLHLSYLCERAGL